MFSGIYSILVILMGVAQMIFSMIVKILPNSVIGFILGAIAGGITATLVYRNNINLLNSKIQQISNAVSSIKTDVKKV